MSNPRHVRLPISTRHAFALAFDLAVRRDAWHSLLLPLALRAPWIVALAVLPAPVESGRPELVTLLTAAGLLGDFLMLVLVGAMLRFRARSVFNTPLEVRPGPAIDCYARGLKRLPWLVVTEIVRNIGILFASFFFVLPGVLLGFRLAFATEAVVLHDPNTDAAFRRSFELTPGRFERWFEMVVVSVLLVLAVLFASAVGSLALPAVTLSTWVGVARLLVAAITPVIQYAWTFFYLRLVESEAGAPGQEPGPLYAAGATAGTAEMAGPVPGPQSPATGRADDTAPEAPASLPAGSSTSESPLPSA